MKVVVDEASFGNRLRALQELCAPIVSNAEYVLRELGTLGLGEEPRLHVQAVWQKLHAGAQELEAMLKRAEDGRSGDLLGELEWIESRLGQRIVALDRLVRALWKAADQDPGLAAVSILVGESGANVLRAYAVLRRGIEELRSHLPTPDRMPRSLREEAGMPEGAELKHELLCATCGQVAALLEVGIDPNSGQRALVYSGLIRREAFGLNMAVRVFSELAAGNLGAVHGLLGVEGIDAYCPACGRVYCRSHYQLVTEYDDGFYDCTRGTCPEGHRRMVDD